MTRPPETSPAARIEAAVHAARARLQQGDYAAALRAAQALLEEVPDNRDVLYLAAVSERYLGRIPQALATLARFEHAHPGYGRLFQERGHCHRASGDMPAAVSAYRRAVELNAALPASWQALAQLEQGTAAADAAGAATRLGALSPALVAAESFLAEDQPHEAAQILRHFLARSPADPGATRLLARACTLLGAPAEAQVLLERLLAAYPGDHAARYQYALVLAQRHQHAAALRESGQLLAAEPAHPAFLTVRGNALTALGQHEQALALFGQLQAQAPQQPDVALCIAHVLKTLGRQPQAIAAYQQAAQLRPGYGEAYWGLANLKTYRFTDGELASMQAALAAPGCTTADQLHLWFALGKALEDRGDYAGSFAHYARGNQLRRGELAYSAAATEHAVALQVRTCDAQFFAARRGYGCPQGGPVFIVGLPRAGSTLLEQILASHSQVEGTWELPEIPRLAAALDGIGAGTPGYPAILARLDEHELRRLGEQYLADTRAYRQGRRYFIDKMPNNFRHVGLIHLMLPNARIIDARREPMACCFSVFRQLFAAGQEFSYDLRDLGRYYRSYRVLMHHWDQVLPGRVLTVNHEDVVADLEGSVRRMLAHLGLEFEPACLEFHSTQRSVRTASSEQVRRPLSREGLEHWQHFRPWLRPLEEALQGEPAPTAE